MPTIGIIAEYNPFHNGHRHQLRQLKTRWPDARLVAVMSGSFTQRGEPAILDKWARAASAVASGLDLVIELPSVFAVASAQTFARGGVSLLAKLGIVDILAFGSGYDDLPTLQRIAALADAPATQSQLHEHIAAGLPYGAALELTLREQLALPPGLLREPNTILAVEYLRAIQDLAAPLTPLPLPRKGAAHNEQKISRASLNRSTAIFASGTAIRRELSQSEPDWALLAKCVPPATLAAGGEAAPLGWPNSEHLWRTLLIYLSHTDSAALRNIHGLNEGLENRLRQAAQHSHNFAEFVTLASSKRYPMARIQRLAACLLLGLTKEEAASFAATGALYARILAFNARGRELLRQAKQTATIPIVTKTTQAIKSADLTKPRRALSPGQQMLAYDLRATDLRNLCQTAAGKTGDDFRRSPLYYSARDAKK